MDRHERETAGAHVLGDCGPLIGAPGCLADGEQRERAGVVEIVERKLAHVLDAPGREPIELGRLSHAVRGLVEYAVRSGGTVAVRRNLGDEEQRCGHAAESSPRYGARA